MEVMINEGCAGGCLAEAKEIDVCGFGWCEEHSFRGQLINWLADHNWMELTCEPYAIAGSKESAILQVLMGCEEYIWTALAYAAYLESEWSK